MRVFICTDHEGHYPVGVASIVVADDEDHARRLLGAELKQHGLRREKPFTLQEVGTADAHALVLLDGNY